MPVFLGAVVAAACVALRKFFLFSRHCNPMLHFDNFFFPVPAGVVWFETH